MLTQFGVRGKMYYLCISEEERALNKRVFSSFFGLKKGIFTSEIKISTLLRKIFLGVCGNFFRNVDVYFADVERLKVKRYLFSKLHFRVFVVPDNYSGRFLRWKEIFRTLLGVSREFVLIAKAME